MMKDVYVEEGQNIYDIALQYYGNVEAVTKLLSDNPELNLDSVLTNRQILQIDPAYLGADLDIVALFQRNGDVVLTEDNPSLLSNDYEPDDYDTNDYY